MLYILINRTRRDLSSEEYEQLGRLAQDFYDQVPSGVKLHGDWAAKDQSRTFTLIETEDPSLLERIQAPFRPFVDIETFEVTPISSWRAG